MHKRTYVRTVKGQHNRFIEGHEAEQGVRAAAPETSQEAMERTTGTENRTFTCVGIPYHFFLHLNLTQLLFLSLVMCRTCVLFDI